MPSQTPVVVDKTQLDLSLQGGIDESTLEESVDWTKRILEAENVNCYGNSIIVRPGLVLKYPNANAPNANSRSMTRLANMDGGLVGINESTLYHLEEQLPSFIRKGGDENVYAPAFYADSFPVDGGFTYGICGVANFTKYKVFGTLTSGSAGSSQVGTVTVVDAASKNVVARWTVPFLSCIVGIGDRYLHIFTNDSTGVNGTSYKQIDFNGTIPASGTLSSFSTLNGGSLPTNSVIAGVAAGSNFSFVVFQGGGTTYYEKITTSGSVTELTNTQWSGGSATDVYIDPSTDVAHIVGYRLDFDPATLSLTGWWREYPNASPWNGTASAGTSGSNALTEATNRPGLGTALNGHAVADFDGTNDEFSGAALSTFFNSGAASGWVLCNIDAINTTGYTAPANSNDQIMCSKGTGVWGIILNGTGPNIYHHMLNNSSVDKTAGPLSIATGTWMLIQFRLDGTNLSIRRDNGAWTNTGSPGTFFALTANLGIGKNVNGDNWYDGKIAEIGLSNTSISDADFDNIRNYINARYGLAI